jgi:hypothetical protein
MHIVFRLENLKGRDHSEDLDVDGKVTLEWILEKWGGVGVCGLDASGLG